MRFAKLFDVNGGESQILVTIWEDDEEEGRTCVTITTVIDSMMVQQKLRCNEEAAQKIFDTMSQESADRMYLDSLESLKALVPASEEH